MNTQQHSKELPVSNEHFTAEGFTAPAALLLRDWAQYSGVADCQLIETSWHNDTCPSFMLSINADSGIEDLEDLKLFVDHADPSQREMAHMPDNVRYCVVNNGHVYYEGDDLEEAISNFYDPSSMCAGCGKTLYQDRLYCCCCEADL